MKRVLLCLLFINYYSLLVHAQNVEQDDINVIKRDTSFIYAEATMLDAIEAQSGARAIMELKLYDWLRSKHPIENADSLVTMSKENWRELLTRRGRYSRVFIFVSKQKVLPKVEVQEPIEEVKTVVKKALTADEETMVNILSFGSIEPYIKGLKEKERLMSYGKYATLPENAPCYMFIYNREGTVVAVLRQGKDGSYFNLREEKDDHVRNYKNCGAIWFQFKEGLNVE